MTVAITVRGVPNEVRDELAARAARAGMSLQEYLRIMLTNAAGRPSVSDVMARAQRRLRNADHEVAVDSILDARDADRR